MLYPIELLRQMTASMVTAMPLFVMSCVAFFTVRHTPRSRYCGTTGRPDAQCLRPIAASRRSAAITGANSAYKAYTKHHITAH